jgi:hypothetical protein
MARHPPLKHSAAARHARRASSEKFDGSTGAFIRSFFNPTPENFELFGNSLATSNNNILVGALRNIKGISRVSAAYLFDGTTGDLIETFLNPDPSVQDSFAQQVAMISNSVLISSPSAPANPGSGVAYPFQPKRIR